MTAIPNALVQKQESKGCFGLVVLFSENLKAAAALVDLLASFLLAITPPSPFHVPCYLAALRKESVVLFRRPFPSPSMTLVFLRCLTHLLKAIYLSMFVGNRASAYMGHRAVYGRMGSAHRCCIADVPNQPSGQLGYVAMCTHAAPYKRHPECAPSVP